jgi:hypothetical protein
MREASCACGQMGIRLEGEPKRVSSCCCQQCQRRTGSFVGVTAFFDDDQVEKVWGESRVHLRKGASGKDLSFRFCPDCGSTVWWLAEAKPGSVAVAGGAFADKEFPAPERIIWTQYKHDWVRVPSGVANYPQDPNKAPEPAVEPIS